MQVLSIRSSLPALVDLDSLQNCKSDSSAWRMGAALAAARLRAGAWFFLAAALLILCGFVFSVPVAAQTAHFGSFESTVVPSGLRTNHNVAVDQSGNVYIPDTQAHTMLKETPAAGGYTQTTIGAGWSTPWGIAIDASGSLYVTDTGLNKLIKLTPSASGYTQSTIASGFKPRHL